MNRWQALEFVSNILGHSQLNEQTNNYLEKRLVNWELVADIASHQLVTPYLYLRIQQRNITALIPPEFFEYLQGIYELNTLRNKEKNQLLKYLVEILHNNNVDCVVMKGGASQVENLYSDQGIRMFSDVDLLIHNSDLSKSVQLLFDEGFIYWDGYPGPPDFNPATNHHFPCLVHPQRAPCRVELHVEALKIGFQSLLRPEHVFKQKRQFDWEGLSVNTPCLEHRLLHNFVHNQLGDRDFYFGRLSLRQMIEFGMLLQQRDAQVAVENIKQILPKQYQNIWQSYVDVYHHLFESKRLSEKGPAQTFIRKAKRHVLNPHLRSIKTICLTTLGSLKTLILKPHQHLVKLSNPHWYTYRWNSIRMQWGDRR